MERECCCRVCTFGIEASSLLHGASREEIDAVLDAAIQAYASAYASAVIPLVDLLDEVYYVAGDDYGTRQRFAETLTYNLNVTTIIDLLEPTYGPIACRLMHEGMTLAEAAEAASLLNS